MASTRMLDRLTGLAPPHRPDFGLERIKFTLMIPVSLALLTKAWINERAPGTSGGGASVDTSPVAPSDPGQPCHREFMSVWRPCSRAAVHGSGHTLTPTNEERRLTPDDVERRFRR
ncbi:MAG TPA: hypothetical protein GXZ60_11000, partial [Intrasporangiaceae bacterium]|nr:hypothetical protein [Intrasporangiaceae bacterium]